MLELPTSRAMLATARLLCDYPELVTCLSFRNYAPLVETRQKMLNYEDPERFCSKGQNRG